MAPPLTTARGTSRSRVLKFKFLNQGSLICIRWWLLSSVSINTQSELICDSYLCRAVFRFGKLFPNHDNVMMTVCHDDILTLAYLYTIAFVRIQATHRHWHTVARNRSICFWGDWLTDTWALEHCYKIALLMMPVIHDFRHYVLSNMLTK